MDCTLRKADVLIKDGKSFLLIKEISFSELCHRHDELLLEYDPDDLWEAYEIRGPPWDVLDETGVTSLLWPEERE